MLRGVEAGASSAHTETRLSGHEPAAYVARESASGARASCDPAALSSNNLQKVPHYGDADPFASPPLSPLMGRQRPRDKPSEDGAITRARAQVQAEAIARASRERAAAESARRTAAERAQAHAHAERANAIIANAVACRGDGTEWLNHSPCYGVPMLTAEEWNTAAHFSLSADRPEFAALARLKAKCACCVDKTHSDSAAWTAHALNVRTGRHGLSPSGLHHRIAAAVNKIALKCGVNSTLGGDRTRCGTDASGQGVLSDVFLADLYPDQRGAGVHLDITCCNVVGGDGRWKGDHKDPDRAINLCLARKAKQYAPFVDKRVMSLAIISGGRMSKDFHTVLYAFARRKVSTALGNDGGGDEGQDDLLTERMQHIAHEKKRMVSAIQAARIAYQARMIMTTTAQRERHSQDDLALGGPRGPRA